MRIRRLVLPLLSMIVLAPMALGHSPTMDSSLEDWCTGAFSSAPGAGVRVEDTSANLSCGNCSVSTGNACVVNADCPSSESCINLGSKTELVWWDNRTDAAVNDLSTLAITHDNTNLYIAGELWVDPDPVSLPFAEIAIDYAPGGVGAWHDPAGVLAPPGHCSVSMDRACTSDADCHFCAISTEPFPSPRPRTCGSGCDPSDPLDLCDTSQICVNVGLAGPTPNVGLLSAATSPPDSLLVFDFSRWLLGEPDAVQLMQPGTTVDPSSPWDPVAVFLPAVNPGASGGSGGPPGAVEVAIPWSAFGCTGCPAACSCPGFGPGQDFRFTVMLARGALTFNYTPGGVIEDVVSEAFAGQQTITTNSCPGFGTGNTACELADASCDALLPPLAQIAGGAIGGLVMTKGAAPSITLSWNPSCSSADTDYEVYEGTVGNWYDHARVPGRCTTGGATTTTFGAGPDDHYYLVVPTNGFTEGSYGKANFPAPTPRPVGTVLCAPQSLGNCP